MPYLEFKEGSSQKFWDIKHTSKLTYRVMYGKLGSLGTKKHFEFKTEKEKNTNYKKLIETKLKKGYKKVSLGSKKKLKIVKLNTQKKPHSSSIKTKKKPCPSGKVVNPKTGRCIKMKLRSGTIKKDRQCPPGKVVNPKTGRCIKMKLRSGTKKKTVVDKVWSIKDGVMLAHTYKDPKTGKINIPPKGTPQAPNGWYLSEKYDGYRAIWDGKNFLSRNGNLFHAPESFKSKFPADIVLDGELFIGREKFEEHGILRKKKVDEGAWEKAGVKFNVFDSPTMTGTFESRMTRLAALVKKLCSANCPIKLVKQTKIKNEKQMMIIFEKLTKQGAEGVMLRAPNSPYEGKRSKYLLKVKQLFDAECRIIGYKKGTGKYKRYLGAFECALEKDPKIKFTISGMDDEIRMNYKTTHPIGTLVTFTYMGLSAKGVPRHPNYLRKRT